MIGENFPTMVDDLYTLPIPVHGIYKYIEQGYFYRLTAGGQELNRVRTALREGGRIPSNYSPLRRDLALDDWTRTLAVATPRERQELIKLAGAGRLKINSETLV